MTPPAAWSVAADGTGTTFDTSFPDVPDADLVRTAALGDRPAFAELISRHGAGLYRFVQQIVHNSADAEDCVQDVVIAAWRHLGSFRGEASFRTWLYVLARRQAVKHATRPTFPASGSRPLQSVHDLGDESLAVVDDRAGPEGESIGNGLLAALDAVLAHLPERQRSVWLLREVEGLSYAEIGAVVDQPTSVVRGLLQRSRAAVAAGLEEWR